MKWTWELGGPRTHGHSLGFHTRWQQTSVQGTTMTANTVRPAQQKPKLPVEVTASEATAPSAAHGLREPVRQRPDPQDVSPKPCLWGLSGLCNVTRRASCLKTLGVCAPLKNNTSEDSRQAWGWVAGAPRDPSPRPSPRSETGPCGQAAHAAGAAASLA